jgi:hypothetical protein
LLVLKDGLGDLLAAHHAIAVGVQHAEQSWRRATLRAKRCRRGPG